MFPNLSAANNEILKSAQDAILSLRKDGLAKATVDLSTGLTGYNLKVPAELLVPLLSRFRQKIPRITYPGKGTNYKQITAVAPTAGSSFAAAEGTRASGFSLTLADVSTTYRSWGRLGSVTWEGQAASGNYEDAKARSKALLLLQFLKEEELLIIGGNRTALGTPTGVATSTSTTTPAGTVAAATYNFRIAALTLEGMARVSGISRPTSGNSYDCTTPPTLDASFGITAAAANTAIVVGAGSSSITATWTAIPGAAGYAVYVDNKLQAVVTQTKCTITTINTTGAAVPAGDSTASTTSIDGMVPQLVAGSGTYLKNLAGPLSAASGIGIPEIDNALNSIYDRVKEEPDRILCGWPEATRIDKNLSSVSNDRINLNVTVGGDSPAASLPRFDTYKSPRGKILMVEENPNLPGGSLIFMKDAVTIPNSEITNAWEMHMGNDIVELEYAMTDPKSEFEDRAFGALASKAPGFQGLIYNIWNA